MTNILNVACAFKGEEIMEQKLETILDELQAMRTEQFGKDENIYRLLGSMMGKAIEIRTILRQKVRNGS